MSISANIDIGIFLLPNLHQPQKLYALMSHWYNSQVQTVIERSVYISLLSHYNVTVQPLVVSAEQSYLIPEGSKHSNSGKLISIWGL